MSARSIGAMSSIIGVIIGLAVVLPVLQQQAARQSAKSAIRAAEGFSVCNINFQPLTSIDWGNLTPGETANVAVYVTNANSLRSFELSVSTSDWNPSAAAQYLAFSWNGEQILHRQMYVIFTLQVYPNCTGITEFSFTITVNFEEVT